MHREKTKGTPTCMTKSEWYRIKVGMTRAEIKRITGVYGTVSYTTLDANGWEKDVTIDYPQCLSNGKKSPYSTVYTSWVNYEYGDEYNDWQDFYVPLHMDYKGSWSTPWA
jgi:hypothetical protein